MNKHELTAHLETVQRELESAISDLPPASFIAASTADAWSAKDILAHLAAWTARCITILFDAEEGQEPDEVDAMLTGAVKLKASDYDALKDRPLELVLGDWRGAHKQLLKRLNNWDETLLFDAHGFSWLHGRSLGAFVDGEIGGRGQAFVTQLKAFGH
ncbi:MAG TPA: ClbS/DfsB family four-helix bundle protein [Anaerolineae bacterium]|jgi:hypothetical protein